jgi:cytochrome c5
MNRIQFKAVVVVTTALLCSLLWCEKLSSAETKQAGVDSKVMSWRERYLQLGQDTYQDACAQCHDEGSDGAPTTGDKTSWSERSPLWSAVLIVHAQNGYLGMPAKGGCATLTEHQVAAAGEYMLSETFPELLRD